MFEENSNFYVNIKVVYDSLNDYFVKRIQNNVNSPVLWNEIYAALKDVEPASVRPIVEGNWETIYFSEDGGRVARYLHRNCGCEESSKRNYCPQCGAKMKL